MARNSRIWQDSLAHATIYEGDATECSKWIGWAKQKLQFMLHSRAGSSMEEFYPVAGVRIRVDTRPNRIMIAAGGARVYPTFMRSLKDRWVYTKPGDLSEIKVIEEPGYFSYGGTEFDDESNYTQGGFWTNGANEAIRWGRAVTSTTIPIQIFITKRLAIRLSSRISGRVFSNALLVCRSKDIILLGVYLYSDSPTRYEFKTITVGAIKSLPTVVDSTDVHTLYWEDLPTLHLIEGTVNTQYATFTSDTRSVALFDPGLDNGFIIHTFSLDFSSYTSTPIGEPKTAYRAIMRDGSGFIGMSGTLTVTPAPEPVYTVLEAISIDTYTKISNELFIDRESPVTGSRKDSTVTKSETWNWDVQRITASPVVTNKGKADESIAWDISFGPTLAQEEEYTTRTDYGRYKIGTEDAPLSPDYRRVVSGGMSLGYYVRADEWAALPTYPDMPDEHTYFSRDTQTIELYASSTNDIQVYYELSGPVEAYKFTVFKLILSIVGAKAVLFTDDVDLNLNLSFNTPPYESDSTYYRPAIVETENGLFFASSRRYYHHPTNPALDRYHKFFLSISLDTLEYAYSANSGLVDIAFSRGFAAIAK